MSRRERERGREEKTRGRETCEKEGERIVGLWRERERERER